MNNSKINASNIHPGCKVFMVVEDAVFPGSDITISDVKEIKVATVSFGPGGDENSRNINDGDHFVKLAGNPSPKVGDIIFDEETAQDVWGETMEKSASRAKKALETAKKDLEAVENHKTVMNKSFLSKNDLKFGKKSETKELVLKSAKSE